MRWSDGSHRPRLMTVEEFRQWDDTVNVARTTQVPTHYPDGTVGPPYVGVMTFPVSFPRGTRLKARLTWWDRWLDRRWERKHVTEGGTGGVR